MAANGSITNPKTTKEAIFDIHARMIIVEQRIGNEKDESGLIGNVRKLWKVVDGHTKLIYFFAGIAVGSGILSGISLAT